MNPETRRRNNREGKCAGCGVIFMLNDNKKEFKYGDFNWCKECYRRRLYEVKHDQRRENIWEH